MAEIFTDTSCVRSVQAVREARYPQNVYNEGSFEEEQRRKKKSVLLVEERARGWYQAGKVWQQKRQVRAPFVSGFNLQKMQNDAVYF